MLDARMKKEIEDIATTEFELTPELKAAMGLTHKTKEEHIEDITKRTEEQLKKHEALADVLEGMGKIKRKHLANELRLGHFTDFAGAYATPMVTLYKKLMSFGDVELAEKVKKGEYD